jgi:hypothetical protein
VRGRATARRQRVYLRAPDCSRPRAGALANKACADGNANALDGGLEALVAFLACADEEYASRCVPLLAWLQRAGCGGTP